LCLFFGIAVLLNVKRHSSGRTTFQGEDQKLGIAPATLYQWKAKYGGMTLSELKRLRELEAENGRLKRMYADLSLEHEALKDVVSRKL
jgi:putative transposase